MSNPFDAPAVWQSNHLQHQQQSGAYHQYQMSDGQTNNVRQAPSDMTFDFESGTGYDATGGGAVCMSPTFARSARDGAIAASLGPPGGAQAWSARMPPVQQMAGIDTGSGNGSIVTDDQGNTYEVYDDAAAAAGFIQSMGIEDEDDGVYGACHQGRVPVAHIPGVGGHYAPKPAAPDSACSAAIERENIKLKIAHTLKDLAGVDAHVAAAAAAMFAPSVEHIAASKYLDGNDGHVAGQLDGGINGEYATGPNSSNYVVHAHVGNSALGVSPVSSGHRHPYPVGPGYQNGGGAVAAAATDGSLYAGQQQQQERELAEDVYYDEHGNVYVATVDTAIETAPSAEGVRRRRRLSNGSVTHSTGRIPHSHRGAVAFDYRDGQEAEEESAVRYGADGERHRARGHIVVHGGAYVAPPPHYRRDPEAGSTSADNGGQDESAPTHSTADEPPADRDSTEAGDRAYHHHNRHQHKEDDGEEEDGEQKRADRGARRRSVGPSKTEKKKAGKDKQKGKRRNKECGLSSMSFMSFSDRYGSRSDKGSGSATDTSAFFSGSGFTSASQDERGDTDTETASSSGHSSSASSCTSSTSSSTSSLPRARRRSDTFIASSLPESTRSTSDPTTDSSSSSSSSSLTFNDRDREREGRRRRMGSHRRNDSRSSNWMAAFSSHPSDDPSSTRDSDPPRRGRYHRGGRRYEDDTSTDVEFASRRARDVEDLARAYSNHEDDSEHRTVDVSVVASHARQYRRRR